MLIVDEMAYVQQLKVVNQKLGDFANDLLQRILVVGARSSCIDTVFDDYRELSIKNVERCRRSIRCHNLFKLIGSSSEIKQCAIFLSSDENKNALVRFIVAEWKKENYRLTIGSKSIFVTDGEVFEINEDTVITIPELESNHEEKTQ